MSTPDAGRVALSRRLLAALPVAAFIALSALFLVRLFAGDVSRIPSALIGKQVPAFALPPLAGLAGTPGLADADLRTGEVTVVNVFASWCVPCHQEHATLMDLHSRGVRLVGIAYKDEPENARRFLGKDGNPFSRIGTDSTGRVGIDFGVTGVPETFVVRGDGTIAYKFVGPLSGESVRTDLLPEIVKASAGSGGGA